MANKKAPVKVVISIVRRDRLDYAVEILNDLGAITIWTVLGFGVDRHGLMSLLGLRESECAVVFSIVKEDKVRRTLEALCRNLEFYKPNRGLAFSISINAISRNALNGMMDWEQLALDKLENQVKCGVNEGAKDNNVIKDVNTLEVKAPETKQPEVKIGEVKQLDAKVEEIKPLKDIKTENSVSEKIENKVESKDVKVENKEEKAEVKENNKELKVKNDGENKVDDKGNIEIKEANK